MPEPKRGNRWGESSEKIGTLAPLGRGSFWASSIGWRALKRSLALWMGPEGWVGRWWVEGRLGGRIEKESGSEGGAESEKIFIQEVEQHAPRVTPLQGRSASHFRAG
jgi:hypothetical protein